MDPYYLSKNRINGFVIPNTVTQFLNSKSSVHLDFKALNRAFSVDFENDVECSYNSLESETTALRKIQRDGRAPLYGVKQGATRDTEFLDAEFCLCLGVNQDEDGICLDYRGDTGVPSIALSNWKGPPEQSPIWITVAGTFDEFLTRYQAGEAME